MKKLSLSALTVLAVLLLSALTSWAASSTFTPPPQDGTIFAVVNFDRTLGTNQNTSYRVAWGSYRKSGTVIHPYGNCSNASPAGFVVMVRHSGADSTPFTLTTSGTIVRGPYLGEAPAEISHACYKLVKLRVTQH
jgi:hypothetical protein